MILEQLDGWFREISDMWPGQAMTLKVNKILHHENHNIKMFVVSFCNELMPLKAFCFLK